MMRPEFETILDSFKWYANDGVYLEHEWQNEGVLRDVHKEWHLASM